MRYTSINMKLGIYCITFSIKMADIKLLNETALYL